MRLLLGIIYILIPTLAWGVSFVSTEFLLRTMGPMIIVAIRFCIGTAALLALLKLKKGPAKLKREHIPYFLLAGGIGIVAYFYFENIGILNIGANDSVLMVATMPIITMLVDSFIYKNKLGIWNVVSVAASFAGVALIVFGGSSSSGGANPVGYVYMLLAIVSWVVYIMSTKKLIGNYPYLDLTFYQFLFSLPFFVFFLPFEHTSWQLVGFEQWAHIIFLSVMASVLGFYFYNKAMDYIGATSSTVFLNFMPIITLIFGYFYLGSAVSPFQIIGCIIIIISATVSVLNSRESSGA